MAVKKAKAALVRVVYETIIEPVRKVALEHGYAIAVHGSLARDIDLLAAPWTEEASSQHELVEAVMGAIREALDGEGYMQGDAFQALTGTKKPHGRRAWSLHVDGTYVDLSVMPKTKRNEGGT